MDGDQWIRGVLVPSSGHAWNHSHIPEESLLMAIRATCSWWEIDFAQCRLLMSDIKETWVLTFPSLSGLVQARLLSVHLRSAEWA